nr:uncharacterized protein CTRU02_06139 [Colletotrichum truncatum]KAF6793267.1 hypothetical protein CTRU02_06139 [Colletotrichum truncatum]
MPHLAAATGCDSDICLLLHRQHGPINPEYHRFTDLDSDGNLSLQSNLSHQPRGPSPNRAYHPDGIIHRPRSILLYPCPCFFLSTHCNGNRPPVRATICLPNRRTPSRVGVASL